MKIILDFNVWFFFVINKNIKPSATESIKIFIGDGVKVGSFEPTPINNLNILFKKDVSNTHWN